jgi:hypothetical protein
MAKRKRKKWKAVPRITPYERRNAIEINDMIRQGVDPLTVSVHSAEGSHKYTYRDLANWNERMQRPFNQTATLG